MMTLEDLKAAHLQERQAAYGRLRGGFPIPMSGTVYWLVIAAMSQIFAPSQQLFYSFVASGAIFPMALLFAALFKNDFMKDKGVATSVLVPAFISMLLFWPMVVVAVAEGSADIALVILAIGLSIHWPVIGWSYGRTAIFCAHSIIRAVLVLALYFLFPEQRFLFIPLAVAFVYAVTVLALILDSGRFAKAKAEGAE